MKSQSEVYFSGLNGIRAIAALLVVFVHTESFKSKIGELNIHGFLPFQGLAHQSVKMFFVLSGFLITYLLLRESSSSDIDVGKFYIRRFLRIWPVYYLVVIIGFLIVPLFGEPSYFNLHLEPNFSSKFILVSTFLSNLVLYKYGSLFMIGILWSVAAEEQFYLFWPWVIKFVKFPLIKILAVLLIFVLIKIILIQFFLLKSLTWWAFFFEKFLVFDCMIVGAVAAYLLYHEHKLLKWVFSNLFVYLSLFSFLCFLVIQPNLYGLENVYLSIVYGGVVLNISVNSRALIKLENNAFDFLGKISYGIYMFHCMFLGIGIWIIQTFDNGFLVNNVLLYLITFGGTILFSYISYTYFEKPILKYKKKFMVIESGKL